MKICIVGGGYVGISLATMLSKNNEVVILDILKSKVDSINKRKSYIKDLEIEKAFNTKLNLKATLNKEVAFKDSRFIIISTPTDFNSITKQFDTKTIENTISDILKFNNFCSIVIKSTIPIGYIHKIREMYKYEDIFFSPEFLREGKALYDNLNPSRIIVGEKTKNAKIFANLLKDSADKKNIPILFTNPKEAESIKLFSNTYLAMRVAFFNELDIFSETMNLDSKKIIDGVSLDNRIGNFYNNPSFGYGGYCLPKDTKQLLSNYSDIPNKIIEAVVKSNEIRKKFIIENIINMNKKTVGIYRLTVKSNSDNFRSSAIIDIISELNKKGKDIIIYEPLLNQNEFKGCKVEENFDNFKKISEIIIANRNSIELNEVKNKVYSRDIYFRE